MSRSRSYRRHQAQRVPKKRMRFWGELIKEWKNDPKQLGRMRKSNFSCNCGMCKPHKRFNAGKFASIQELKPKYRR